VTDLWLDFSFQGRRILIRLDGDDLRFFVADSLCPDLVLYRVAQHFERLPQNS
jgi:hypothetical protein